VEVIPWHFWGDTEGSTAEKRGYIACSIDEGASCTSFWMTWLKINALSGQKAK